MENLQQIRELALETQEKLIVPEETVSQGTQSPKQQETQLSKPPIELQETRISKPTAVELQATQIPKQSKAQLQGAQFDHDLDVEQLNIPLPRQSETELQGLRLDQEQIEAPQGAPRLGQHTVVQATTPSDPWEMLREILTSVEVGALRVIESKQSLTAFALEQGIMGEVLIEGINEKAMDCIGDMLLEMDEEVMIYEDYLPFLGKITHS